MPESFREPDRSARPARGAATGSAALAALALAAVAAPAAAQIRIEARAPVAVQPVLRPGAGPLEQPRNDDPGPPVQMLESPNIDRFLRKAQDFLSRENYPSAVKLLQDVIEGRTLVEGEGAAAGAPGTGEPAGDSFDDLVADARHAVFSLDGRLYRPVVLLCHELLAAMPPAGIAFYRAQFEVEAERALAAALADGALAPLEAVFHRWFVTHAAARAMVLAGERLLDQGRPREAIQVFRLLLDVWPAADREAAGIDTRYVHLKVALALEIAGDAAAARVELAALATAEPGVSLRVGGELTAIGELAGTGFGLATAGPSPTAAGGSEPSTVRVLGSLDERLVPVWEFRFADPDPYRRARSDDATRGIQVARGDGLAPTPPTQQFRSGPKVTFTGERATFLDHFRITSVEVATGRLVAANDGPAKMPDPVTGQPRLRVPAYDHGALRAVAAHGRHYAVVGPAAMRLGGMETVLRNDLEAWTESGAARVWNARQHPEFEQTTWLAAPTPFGPWLLAPTWRRDTVELTCVDGDTGRPIYRVPLHRGGSSYARPPGVPVVIDNGTAFVVTNAGAVAAVDALTGGVRWIRRYERAHPLRERAVQRPRPVQQLPFGGTVFQELPIDGFAPSDPLVVDGLVVFGATDSDVLLCLDGSTGDAVWMVSRHGELLHPIGHDGEFVYVAGRDQLMCIGLRSGVRLWSAPIPPHESSSAWRGRPAIWNGLALVPGAGSLLARPLREQASWTTLTLPDFQPGHTALEGPFDVEPRGPWLVLSHPGGLAAYSSATALAALAAGEDDPLRAATRLAQAGDLPAAIDRLDRVDAPIDSPAGRDLARRMLALCVERAMTLAQGGEGSAALALLDRARARIADVELVQRWHLARVEVFQRLGDLDAVYEEQDRLYQVMSKSGT